MTALVADASPLIALHQIGQLPLLKALFTSLVIPPAVALEIAPSVPQVPLWITTRTLSQPIASQVLRANLGAGESEAISLSLELGDAQLLVDERSARRLAQAVGLSVIGTLGVLLAGKRKGLLAAVRPHIDSLLQQGFWVTPQLVKKILTASGEGSEA